MARKNELRSAGQRAGDACRDVIPCDMCVDDLDLIVANEPGHPVCAQDTERISDRYMKDIGRWEKPEPILPDVRRPEGHEHLVPFLLQAAAQVDKMPFAAAIRPRR